MIGALYNGLTGVTAQSSGLNVTANNIANANTTAYKADTLSFARAMYDSTVVGSGNTKIGSGVGTFEVEKNFEQGNLAQSKSYYDFAIEGKGFFLVNDIENDDTYYTRAGNFQKSDDGFLQDQNGFNVLGVKTDITNVASTNAKTRFDEDYIELIGSKIVGTEDFTISFNARANDYSRTATDIGTSGDHFKTRGTLLAEIDLMKRNYTDKLSKYESDSNADSIASTNQSVDITYGNWQNELSSDGSFVQVYLANDLYTSQFDTDATTTMKNFADKISNLPGYSASFDDTTGTLTIDNLIPGQNTDITVPFGDYTAPTITETPAIEGSGLEMVNSARDALSNRIQLAGGEFMEIQNTIPAPNQDAISVDSLDLKLENLGFTNNNDTTFEATGDGLLLLNQLGNTYLVGRLSTAYFADPETLNPFGANLYEQTVESGVPKNADKLNTIHTNFLEKSNTNLAEGFNSVLRSQRAFEASSKAISTSDEFLKTAINLKNS